MTDEKKSLLDLPERLQEKPLTTLNDQEKDEFRRNVLRRCTDNQLSNGLREATSSYTFGRGDEIDYDLMVCYEAELNERKARVVFKGGRFTLDREDAERFALFIRRHSQYIFSSANEGHENLDYS